MYWIEEYHKRGRAHNYVRIYNRLWLLVIEESSIEGLFSDHLDSYSTNDSAALQTQLHKHFK